MDTLLMFLFQIGAIKRKGGNYPSWHTNSFYSKLVRLKGIPTTQNITTHSSFYSKLVRLKVKMSDLHAAYKTQCFYSKLVRLKGAKAIRR